MGGVQQIGCQAHQPQDETVQDSDNGVAYRQLYQKPHRAGVDTVQPGPQQGIPAEECKHQGGLPVRHQQQSQNGGGAKGRGGGLCAVFLQNGQEDGHGENRPGKHANAQNATQQQHRHRQGAQQAAEGDLLAFHE